MKNFKEPERIQHRQGTAKEMARKFGICERTVRAVISERRTDYEKRAREKRKLVFDLHSRQKKTYREIGEQLNISTDYVYQLFKKAQDEFGN